MDEQLLSPSKVAEHPGFIYAMRCRSFVKIGWSKDVKRRLNQINSCNPYTISLMGTVIGTIGDESSLHMALRQERHQGEWFRYQNFTQMAVEKFEEFETAKEVIIWLDAERKRLLEQSKEAQAKAEAGEEWL